jgi:hypothetical protein
MAVVDLGNNSTFASQQTIAITALTNAVPVIGTLVVAFVEDFNGVTTGIQVTDTKSNTYLPAAVNYTLGVGHVCCSMFYSFINTPLTTGDSIIYHAATGFGANGMAINACSATGYSSFDAATANSATGTSATFSVTAAHAAAFPNEIFFGFVISNNVPTITGAGTWNTAPPNGTPFANEAAYQISSGTPTCSGTLTSQQWVVLIASFAPTGAQAPIVGTKLIFQ